MQPATQLDLRKKRSTRKSLRAIAGSWLLAGLGACATVPSPEAPREYLDEMTGATISIAGKPLVFAHERREMAANTRDYVTLAAASVNRGGKVTCVLIGYFWSTLDVRAQPATTPAAVIPADTLVIAADDRRIRPLLQGHSTQEAGIGAAVHAPPGHSAAPNVYRTELPTLRFIAEARHVRVVAGPEDSPVSYELWEDQRPALQSLVKLLSGERSAFRP